MARTTKMCANQGRLWRTGVWSVLFALAAVPALAAVKADSTAQLKLRSLDQMRTSGAALAASRHPGALPLHAEIPSHRVPSVPNNGHSPAPSNVNHGDKGSTLLREIPVGGTVATLSESRHVKSAGSPPTKQLLKRNATPGDRGSVTAAQSGLGALVSPDMHDSAVIHAQVGKTSLASRKAFTLDLYGDQLVRLVVNDKVIAKMTDVNGRPLGGFVSRPGPLQAQDVLITTATARAALDNVVNVSRVTPANVFQQRAGHIVLSSGLDANVTASKAPVKIVGKGPAIAPDPKHVVMALNLKTPKFAHAKPQPKKPDCQLFAVLCPSPNPAVPRTPDEVPVAGPLAVPIANPAPAPTSPPSVGSSQPGADQPGTATTHGSTDPAGWSATTGTASFADLGRAPLNGGSSDVFSRAQARGLVQANTAGADQTYFQSSAADYVVIRAARRPSK